MQILLPSGERTEKEKEFANIFLNNLKTATVIEFM